MQSWGPQREVEKVKKQLGVRSEVLTYGHQVHVVQSDEGGFEVWLNTSSDDFDGICIGHGPTLPEASLAAAKNLSEVVQALTLSSSFR